MKSFVIAATLIVLAGPAIAVPVTPADAHRHLGETATVEGVIADVRMTPTGMVLLDLGGRDPDNQFVALIFSKNTAAFGPMNAYIGQLVQISGTIQTYHGKPEITLTNAGQLQIITAAHNQKLTS